jgi:hypothetical protein
LLLGGALLGATGITVQAVAPTVAGRTVPLGLVLTWLAIAAGVRGGCWAVRRRLGGAVVGAGWLLVTLLLATSGPGDDVLLAEGVRSQVYLLGGILVALGCALLPLPARDAAATPSDQPAQGSADLGR